jgi:hypothetical protein
MVIKNRRTATTLAVGVDGIGGGDAVAKALQKFQAR